MSAEILEEIFEVIKSRKRDLPPNSYVAKLLKSGKTPDKIREESEEFIEAAAKGGKQEVVHEAADLIFHTMVLLAEKGVELKEVMEELKRRRR